MYNSIETGILIVGSGTGGATVAKELAQQGKNILILEKGKDDSISEKSEKPSLIKSILVRYHEGRLIESISRKLKALIFNNKNIPISYRIGVGGTTTVAGANAVKSLEEELLILGINIKEDLEEIEQELNIAPFPQNLRGKGAKILWDASNSLGLKMEPMPKFIDFNKCYNCKRCYTTCPRNANWTAIDFIKMTQNKRTVLLQDTRVEKVLTSNGRAVGVEAKNSSGRKHIMANIVVLAAGAIGTSIILQKSGIESAGKKLFCDPYYNIYGPHKTELYTDEPHSIIDLEFVPKNGFMFTNSVVSRYPRRIFGYHNKFLKYEAEKPLLGIMIKIKDESVGSVSIHGRIKKTMTFNDLSKLDKGVPIAKEILIRAGVDHRYIKLEGPHGVHPGGTAAIGDVVDTNQETEIKNLFISDASVLPTAPGLPPMLTIIALSKRFAKRLSKII